MARSKGDGSKTLLRRYFATKVDSPNWGGIEKLVGRLPDETKSKIKTANAIFANVRMFHARGNVVRTKEVAKLLLSWLKISRKLEILLNIREGAFSKEQIIELLQDTKELEIISPLQRFGYLLHLTKLVGGAALNNVIEKPVHPEVKNDLWLIWATLIALHIAEAGYATSAGGRDKSADGSPFVLLIEKLQTA